jgi:hypothetical protein
MKGEILAYLSMHGAPYACFGAVCRPQRCTSEPSSYPNVRYGELARRSERECDYIGALSLAKLKQLRSALAVASDIEDDPDDLEPT